MISSRTPEGSPNHCPVCGHDVCIEPSLLTADAPCPSCGHLLWFGASSAPRPELLSQLTAEERERLWQFLAEQLNVPAETLKQDPKLLERFEGADSLDTIELVMELEGEAM